MPKAKAHFANRACNACKQPFRPDRATAVNCDSCRRDGSGHRIGNRERYHRKVAKRKYVPKPECDADEFIDDGKLKPRREALARLFERYDGLHFYRTAPASKVWIPRR